MNQTCRTSDNPDGEANVALSIIADRVLAQRGGVVLTVFVIPDPDHDDCLVRHVVNTRSGRAHNIKIDELIEAAAKECHRAVRHLNIELTKEVFSR